LNASVDGPWDQDQAVDAAVRAIEQLIAVLKPRPANGLSTPILTPQELAVLELVGSGHTNREIADALYISSSPACVHVSNILRKLGAKRRVNAAGLAHTLGLLPTA
jgi:DNA-binding NarL/FixJ family response regulator